MHVVGNIYIIIVPFIFLNRKWFAIHHADMSVTTFRMDFPCVFSMIGKFGITISMKISHCKLMICVEYTMFLAKLNQSFYIIQKRLIFCCISPVKPTDVIILTITVIITLLTVTEFIACKNHGSTLSH